jgi:acetyl esterase
MSGNKPTKATKKLPEHKIPFYKHLLKFLIWVVIIFAVLVGIVWVAFQVSPWPSALLIRDAFDKNSLQVSRALEKYVPDTVDSMLNQQYRQNDNDGYMDVYFPKGTNKPLPTVVWVHGGGWISGDKSDIANYMKILAGKGYTVIAVDYTIAPEKQYPVPVIQVGEALGYINQQAERLHVDANQIVLAGDSAGSQIASQVAAMVTNPDYAKEIGIATNLNKNQLVGMLLNCGAYDIKIANADGDDEGAKLLRTFLWSYSGRKDFMNDAELMQASVIEHVTKDFPPSFITAGNQDPLLQQSLNFTKKLKSLGVEVSDLFYPDNYTPPLNHEYQFVLDNSAGKLALDRMTQFLATHTKK